MVMTARGWGRVADFLRSRRAGRPLGRRCADLLPPTRRLQRDAPRGAARTLASMRAAHSSARSWRPSSASEATPPLRRPSSQEGAAPLGTASGGGEKPTPTAARSALRPEPGWRFDRAEPSRPRPRRCGASSPKVVRPASKSIAAVTISSSAATPTSTCMPRARGGCQAATRKPTASARSKDPISCAT